MQVFAEPLTRIASQILSCAGANSAVAQTVAKRLVTANLCGHDSHGVGMIPAYVQGISAGHLDVTANAEIVQDNGPFLLVDGHQGFGQVVAEQAMVEAIERARKHHFSLLSLRNSFHIGRIGDWGEMAAGAGFISIHYVNVLSRNALVAPFGGSDARFSTNPYCTAIPAHGDTPMLVLDMASSTIAHGKARVAHLSAKSVPDGAVIDSKGIGTSDPGVLFEDPKGALTTFGVHKGFGLAVLGDLLGGSFSGGGAFQPGRTEEGKILNNMLAILIDPDVFGEADAFYKDAAAYTSWVKASPPAPGTEAVMFPGDPERLSRDERTRNGIPIDTGTWTQLIETADSVGFSQAEIDAITNA